MQTNQETGDSTRISPHDIEIGVMSMPLGKRDGQLVWYQPDGEHRFREDKFGVIFAELGIEGWELVAITEQKKGVMGGGGRQVVSYTFKRPIEEYQEAHDKQTSTVR